MTNQPFFTRDRDAFIPTPAANGPWDPKSLHGRVIIGLLAFVIEARHGGEGFVPARLTVDMFRLPGFAPIEVKSRVIRDGLRIKVVEAEFISGGVSDGARVVPVAAQDRKSGRPGLVAAELEGARARGDSGARRSAARHERQMDHPPDRRRDGHRRPAAAVDERGARPRRGRGR